MPDSDTGSRHPGAGSTAPYPAAVSAPIHGAIQDDCQLVADASPADSNLVMPKGPCVRTRVAVTGFSPAKLRGDAVGIQFRCVTAPGEALPDPRPG